MINERPAQAVIDAGEALAQYIREATNNIGFTRRILGIQQEQENMAINFGPQRRNGNLPPFEQLQQGNEARARNVGIPPPTVSINISPTQAYTLTPGTHTLTGNFDHVFRDIYVQDSPQSIRRQTADHWTRTVEHARVRQEKKNRQAIYIEWFLRNSRATEGELNSPIHYFRKQKKSIEVDLLNAIADGIALNTKTTIFDPKTYQVKLFGHTIATIDRDTYRLVTVHLSSDIARVELFRHRLRQLGARCLKIKNENRFYYAKDSYEVVVPGKVIEIPYSCNIICLPKTLYKKSLIELPRQRTLDFIDEWEILEAFEGGIMGYPLRIFVKQCEHGMMFKGALEVNYSFNNRKISSLEETVILGNEHLAKDKIKSTITTLKANLNLALAQCIKEYEKELAMKYSGVTGQSFAIPNYQFTGTITGNPTNTITWNNSWFTIPNGTPYTGGGGGMNMGGGRGGGGGTGNLAGGVGGRGGNAQVGDITVTGETIVSIVRDPSGNIIETWLHPQTGITTQYRR